MTVFIETSAWSLVFRRDFPPHNKVTTAYRSIFETNQPVVSAGVVLQELLQGFTGPKFQVNIIDQFQNLDLLVPMRDDYIEAARIRNICRRAGVQLGTVDAFIAALCIREGATLLTADKDFSFAAKYVPLQLLVDP